jgi:hypothetical protein
MADAYQIETSTDRYLMEDSGGVYLLEAGDTGPVNSGMFDFWGALLLWGPYLAVFVVRRVV